MSDYIKRIEDLVKEIKLIKQENKKLTEELKHERNKNFDFNNYIENKNKEIQKLNELIISNTRINKQTEKKFLAVEKGLKNKLRRKEFYECKIGNKNKMENLLRNEIKDLETRNNVLEEVIVFLGENLYFDGNLINKISEFAESKDDQIISEFINRILSRNEK